MIYIVTTGNLVTGGPETLHQAGYILKKSGYNVQVYYVDPHVMNVPERFKQYGIEACDTIEDSSENILIIPETSTYLLRNYHNIRVCIWWLSLDNYNKMIPSNMVKWRMEVNHWPSIMFPFVFVAFLFKGKFHFGHYKFDDNNRYFHGYNCEHARLFLERNGIDMNRTIYLCGPLNEAFFENCKRVGTIEREDLILYNPKKGSAFTQKIINEAQNRKFKAQFIPIINMTPQEIVELMLRAKVYMDFGNFPGPERIPREAVTLGCNIITSLNGSAGSNEIDIPIPGQLKFEDNESNIDQILDTIESMLEDYERYYHYYDAYREKVRKQLDLLPENLGKLLVMIEEE